MRAFKLTSLAVVSVILVALLSLSGGQSAAQSEEVVEIALIHSTSVEVGDFTVPALFPNTIRVKLNQKVRLFNTSIDSPDFLAASPHDPVFISTDDSGANSPFTLTVVTGPESKSENAFNVGNGSITVVEFIADKTGEFFITHKKHGHGIVGKLIVE